MTRKNAHVRVSGEFLRIINFIRAKHILEGKKPPSTTQITRIIANKIKKEELVRHEFLRL